MRKRKINAGMSLLSTVLLLGHAISLSLWMLTKGSIGKPSAVMPWILTCAVLAHALISIDLAVSAHTEKPERKGKSYGKLNLATILQRATGVIMLLLAALHIAGAAGNMQMPKVIHAFVPALFFTIVLAHIAVSGSKAFITLGIGSAGFVKAADFVIKVICAATLVTTLTGFYLYGL